MSKKTKKNHGSSKPDRLLQVLLVVACISLLCFAVLASMLAYHYQSRTKVLKIELIDIRESYADFKSKIDVERTGIRQELTESDILRDQLSIFFRQLLLEEQKPKDIEDILQVLQQLFNQLAGESLSREEMITIVNTLKDTLGLQMADYAKMIAEKKRPVNVRGALEQLVAAGVLSQSEKQTYLRVLGAKENPKPKVVPQAQVKPKEEVEEIIVPPTVDENEWQRKVDRKHAYAIEFPPDWKVTVDEAQNGIMASAPRNDFKTLYTAYAVVNARQLENATDRHSFIKTTLERIQNGLNSVEVISAEDKPLGKKSAHWVELKFKRINLSFKSRYIFLLNKNVGYVVSVSSSEETFEQNEELFQEILQSIRFF